MKNFAACRLPRIVNEAKDSGLRLCSVYLSAGYKIGLLVSLLVGLFSGSVSGLVSGSGCLSACPLNGYPFVRQLVGLQFVCPLVCVSASLFVSFLSLSINSYITIGYNA